MTSAAELGRVKREIRFAATLFGIAEVIDEFVVDEFVLDHERRLVVVDDVQIDRVLAKYDGSREKRLRDVDAVRSANIGVTFQRLDGESLWL